MRKRADKTVQVRLDPVDLHSGLGRQLPALVQRFPGMINAYYRQATERHVDGVALAAASQVKGHPGRWDQMLGLNQLGPGCGD